ncbi:MAG: helix-turn-helix transcriptional regulator [Lachnospiraceae bacterium]|nr:helix-turn-helix transcriptional regulator [Lachnospiraceae bacterium]
MTEKDYLRIAKAIKKYRLLNHMTQEQLAYELDLDTQYYSQLEQGRRHFTLERIVDACNVFHVRIEDIVRDTDNIAQQETQAKLLRKQIADKLSSASYKQLTQINRFIDAFMETLD